MNKNYNIEKTVVVKEMIELLAFFLGIWISNHQLVAKLEEISTIDALTGLNNRYSMVRKIRDLTGKNKTCGIVNLDLNGLKFVNDNEGHEAGDRLLIRASEVLREVFNDEDIYRTGGDEFLVIIEGISEESFDSNVEKLHEVLNKCNDVSFAFGNCWSNDSSKLDEMLRLADKRMYDNKMAYYKRIGLKNRRKI